MAQMTESLARAILNGAGCTRHELEQLCRHFLATPASPATINHDGIDSKLIDDATPAGSAEGVANLAVKVAGEAQRWHERAIAAESEAARLRELLRRAQPCVRHTAGNVAQRLGMDYAKFDYELLAAIDAAMGSANGQG